MPVDFSHHEFDPMLMIEPPPASIMPGTTAWMAKNMCRKLVAKRSSQYSGVTSSQPWRSSRAALLTSTVGAPMRSAIRAKAARSWSMSRRSQGSKASSPSVPATSASAVFSSKSTKPTRAPCAAKAFTISAPMPEAPPVTRTDLPFRLG